MDNKSQTQAGSYIRVQDIDIQQQRKELCDRIAKQTELRDVNKLLREELDKCHQLERIVLQQDTANLSNSIYTRCNDCRTFGICFPHDRKCGNCGSCDVVRYYPETAIFHFVDIK